VPREGKFLLLFCIRGQVSGGRKKGEAPWRSMHCCRSWGYGLGLWLRRFNVGGAALEQWQSAWLVSASSCAFMQISNRMLCIRNHVIAAALLNRTLIAPLVLPSALKRNPREVFLPLWRRTNSEPGYYTPSCGT